MFLIPYSWAVHNTEEILLESCRILEELDGIKIKNKKQNGFCFM